MDEASSYARLRDDPDWLQKPNATARRRYQRLRDEDPKRFQEIRAAKTERDRARRATRTDEERARG